MEPPSPKDVRAYVGVYESLLNATKYVYAECRRSAKKKWSNEATTQIIDNHSIITYSIAYILFILAPVIHSLHHAS